MSGTSGSAAVSTLNIVVSIPFYLHNTAPSTPTLLSGNYIAVPQPGSHPLSYDLFEVDPSWVPKPVKLANVFISVDATGTVNIS